MDMEKVLTWLEICGKNNDCSGCCPYSENGLGEYGQCRESLMADAFALLKEQEPRVMTLSEIEQSEECIVWFEDDQFNKNTPYNYAVVDGIDQRNGWIWLRTVNNTGSQQRRDYENYGKRWRCWTKRPTEDQRKAAKWE